VKDLLNLNHINALLSSKESVTPISDYLHGEPRQTPNERKNSNPQFRKMKSQRSAMNANEARVRFLTPGGAGGQYEGEGREGALGLRLGEEIGQVDRKTPRVGRNSEGGGQH